jgi:diguanylate cyclase (GGDEF)-like protein
VAADAGAALYLDDGDGALTLVASTQPTAQSSRWMRLLRREGGEGPTLIVPVPDAAGGMLVLERSGRNDFTREDRALAGLYARQLTDQVRLGGTFRVSVWTRQLEAIQRIAAQLTRLASIEQVGAAICRETRQVMDYDEAHVLIAGVDGRMRSVASAPGPAGGAVPAALAHGSPVREAIMRAVTSAAPLLLPEISGLAPRPADAWTMMVVPLRFEGRVSGVICLLKQGVAKFDDDDVRLLQILADQAAVAVENAALLARKQKLVRELNGLLDVSTAASQAATDELSLAATLAVKVRQTAQMDAAVIWRLEEGSTVLYPLSGDQVILPPPADLAGFPARRQVLRDRRPAALYAREADGAGVAAALSGAEHAGEIAALAASGFSTVLLLPLMVGGREIGLIELFSHEPAQMLDEAEMQAYLTMASSVASGLENQRLLVQLREAADVDPLTGVNNHRYLQDRLRQEMARSARSRGALSVLMLDLDDFKPINDRYGHAEGDRLLRAVATAIRSHVRTNDIVARYGGDEFVVVMPDTDQRRAVEVAQRVVAGVRGCRHELAAGGQVGVGASAGLAVYPDDGRTAAALLQAADTAMYEAKRAAKGGRPTRPEAPPQHPAFAPAAG